MFPRGFCHPMGPIGDAIYISRTAPDAGRP